eukprot:TRINITY_DN1184_c0_g1_i1.p1 TRINITY_DN1184_c0_g1~~TRINITY_DN1184_c0_g1_i1.p1  ORF type:complete len:238 (+),score=83.87 TRINITY_DN1184_c0_g1_i1:85-714(+)
MSRAPYLHPSQRNLATDGPSSHKNSYHVGVLQGNWVEDRAAIGVQETRQRFDAETIKQAAFKRPPKGVSYCRQPIPQGETQRQLMFGHGSDFHQTNYTSLNELTFTDLSAGDGAVRTGVAFYVTGDSRRNSMAQRKKAQWEEETNPEQVHFLTQNNVTHDATALHIHEHKPPAAQCQRKHPITRQLNAGWLRANLRGTFELKTTPLQKR